MLNSIIDLLCFTLETMKDVIFISALIGRKFRDMRHPIIGTAAYLILGNTVSLIFPNAFGWLALCLQYKRVFNHKNKDWEVEIWDRVKRETVMKKADSSRSL